MSRESVSAVGAGNQPVALSALAAPATGAERGPASRGRELASIVASILSSKRDWRVSPGGSQRYYYRGPPQT